MSFEIPNVMPALPEIFILSMACIILVVDLFLSKTSRGATYMLSQASLVIAVLITVATFVGQPILTFSDTFIRDGIGDVLKIAVYIATFMAFLYAKDYLKDRDLFKGEFYVLGLFAVLGMMILISAHNFLTIYLGLELLSLSLYALVAMHRDSAQASEAAMKYFVLGAIASGMLLYGMSMIYGITGSLDLAVISEQAAGVNDKLVLTFGIVFLLIGVAFKLGAVPFHMWVPDVYHGAPTAVTLFIGSAPKLAAFAMLMRLLIDGLGSVMAQWQDILILLILMSLAVGNIVAIAQANIKRMLAYSTISHIGFLMLGVMTGTQAGVSASMFYTITYTLMSLGSFGMIILLSRKGFEAEKLEDFKGLNERSPWYAFLMMILMFSMAGVPPFLGFWAKMSVLREVVAVDMIWLAAASVVFSIIGAFYYLRVIKIMYFDKAEAKDPILCSKDMSIMISLNAILVLMIGLFPDELLSLCLKVVNVS